MLTQSLVEKKLIDYKLGLARGTIHLVDYQQRWNDAYQFIAQNLQSRVPATDCFHIGSTAFKTIAAKPILDILLLFDDPIPFERAIDSLETFGFTYKGSYGIDGRYFFAYYDSQGRIDFVHIHAFQRFHPYAKRLRRFTQHMISQPHLARRYEQLKKNLVISGVSRAQYPGRKTQFIESVLPSEPSPNLTHK